MFGLEVILKFRYPEYYDRFACIADRCEDTCCAGWEIDIDDASFSYYQSVGGEFGERLRRQIREYEQEEEDVYEKHGFILKEDKRCPFLDENNLCVIYRELGEKALCSVCTDTPRNYLEYGGAREVSLSASCAEAGRLIYGSREPIAFVERELEEELDFEESEEELALAEAVRWARDQAIRLLQNRTMSVENRICVFLHFAKKVQDCLNEDDIGAIQRIDITTEIHDTTTVEKEGCNEQMRLFLSRLRSFSEMESISEEWERMLGLMQKRYLNPADGARRYAAERRAYDRSLVEMEREYEKEHLMVYYSFLCLARCVVDYDFLGKAKLAVTSFLMIRDMDTAWYGEHQGIYTKEDRVMTARIYAKEVEHSEVNLSYLADEFLFEEAYTIENLCASLTSL